MKQLDEKGFVFLDGNNRPFLCAKWTDGRSWLFYWHADRHWVSLRPTNQTEIWQMPKNLSDEHQQVYRDQHKKWEDNQPKIPYGTIFKKE